MDETDAPLYIAAQQGAKQAGVCWCFVVLLISLKDAP